LLWEPEAALTVFVWVNIVVGVIMLLTAHWVMAADKYAGQVMVNQSTDDVL